MLPTHSEEQPTAVQLLMLIILCLTNFKITLQQNIFQYYDNLSPEDQSTARSQNYVYNTHIYLYL